MVKNVPANTGHTGECGSIPGWGRFPSGVNGNPLQYYCLKNSKDRGASLGTVLGVAKSRTLLSTHMHAGSTLQKVIQLYMYVHSFIFFSTMVNPRMLSIVPCAIH